MRSRVQFVLVVTTLMLSVLCWSGCSKKSKPSDKNNDKVFSNLSVKKPFSHLSSSSIIRTAAKPSNADIIKAIDDSGVMKREDGSLTVVPPVKIMQIGKQDKGGSWPVKVKFTLTYRMKDGKTTPPAESITSFRVIQVKDNSGKAVWKVEQGT
jgi:hypothetical protein